MLKAGAGLPVVVHESVEDDPEMIVLGFAMNDVMAGAVVAGVTVTVAVAVAVPALFVAVSLYVVVTVGLTAFEVPVTAPTPLSMLKAGAGFPVTVQERVDEVPETIEAGEAANDVTTGAVVGGGGGGSIPVEPPPQATKGSTATAQSASFTRSLLFMPFLLFRCGRIGNLRLTAL